MSTNRYMIDEARALMDAQTGTFDGPAWLADARDAARREATEQGLPSTRVEDWKYSDLRSGLGVDAEDGVNVWADIAAIDLRMDDLPAGVTVQGFADADEAALKFLWQRGEDDLDPLNQALASDGMVVTVTKEFTDQRPLLLALPAGHSRSLIRIEQGAIANLVEHASGRGLHQHVVRIDVAENAKLAHLRARTGGGAMLVRHDVSVAANASYEGFSLFTGGGFTRAETHGALTGEGADCRLHGAYLLGGKDHLDIRTVMSHAAPNAYSDQLFKGVLSDQARAIYQGRVSVARGADGTKAHQLSKAVLLSNRAEIDHKPELEIFADDVECSHGATAGALDQDALFYLQSRGIPADQSRALLIAAFVEDTLLGITTDGLRKAVAAQVQSAFAGLTERAG